MNSDIRSLQLLERDLERVAAREHERIAVERAKLATGGSSGGPRNPRRLPGRGAHWPAVAAVVVAFLVIAGGIGFLAQGGSSDNSGGGASGGGATGVPDAVPGTVNAQHAAREQSGATAGTGTGGGAVGDLSAPGVQFHVSAPN